MTKEIHVTFEDDGTIIEADCEVTYRVKGKDWWVTDFYWQDVCVTKDGSDDCEFYNDHMPETFVEQAEELVEIEVGKEVYFG